MKAVQLYQFDLELKFYIQTDASDKGISSVMFQMYDHDDHRLVSVVSRGLYAAKLNYTTTESTTLSHCLCCVEVSVLSDRTEVYSYYWSQITNVSEHYPILNSSFSCCKNMYLTRCTTEETIISSPIFLVVIRMVDFIRNHLVE